MLQADDRVHFTHLKNMQDSPAHYVASVEEGFESASFEFGRLVHFLVLGGNYVIWENNPDGSTRQRRGKVWEAFKAAHKGKEIFTQNDLAEASRVAAAVRADPVVQRLGLLAGEKELLVDWDNHGVPFRSHLDVIGIGTNGRRHLADLKTTQCAKPEKFHWEARRYAYHAQLATYSDAAATQLKTPVDDAYVIAVEKKLPYAVVVYKFSPALLEEGRQLCRLWLEKYRICAAAGQWPGYVQDVVPLDVQTLEEVSAPLVLTMHDGTEVSAA